MTLAAAAQRSLGREAEMIHAFSPAVPPAATERVRLLAAREGWHLRIINAGEFADSRYRENPVNRCFFCKTNLYAAMARATDAVLLSGTNLDDLGDFRPGLQAAADHGVRHPYVEAGIGKAGVRALARAIGLGNLAELPAAPCLSSRVETGLAIEPDALRAIDAVESVLRAALSPETVRCRLRRGAICIEFDEPTLAALTPVQRQGWARRIAARFARIGVARPVRFVPYRRGSAFLRNAP
jgi:uncharacterized protein